MHNMKCSHHLLDEFCLLFVKEHCWLVLHIVFAGGSLEECAEMVDIAVFLVIYG